MLGEILRKLHSATTASSSSVITAGARAGREAVAAGEGGEGQRGEGARGWLAGERLRGLAEQDHNFHIHHFARRGLIFPFLPHGRLRLWGISFL